MNEFHEAELLKGAKVFDMQSLGLIYDQYSPGLYSYALRLLGDECLAEDCVAETFSRFLKSLRAGHGPDLYLRAYLYRVAHNWITDQYRRHAPLTVELDEQVCGEEEDYPENQTNQRLEQEHIRTALRSLTPDQRQVITLRFFEGWENEEVAVALRKPIGAIKSLQHRALASLQTWLLHKEKESNYAEEY